MERIQMKQALTEFLQHLPANQQVLSFAVGEFLNKLHEPRRLSDILSSKMTVRQTAWALSWMLQKGLITASEDNGNILYCLSQEPNAHYPRPYTTGQHLVDYRSVEENPLYRQIATALLEEKKSEFDQSIETPESQARRYKMMQALGDCDHESILLLGDDALFSLFLATHGVTSEIYVADIDRDLLSFIRNTADQYQLNNIHVIEYNIFEDLPEHYQGAFDCFAVNGFKDLGGLLTFICRGLQSLKKPCSYKTGYFNFGSPDISDEKLYNMEFEIQKFLTRVGVTLEHIVPAPESYVPPEFERKLSGVIRQVSQESDIERKMAQCDQAFVEIKEEFKSTSWVLIENFPDIHLSPLRNDVA
ncbi:bis-aminopropyl spermidine synthase family protein [Hahella ganghwensis]|uniref:bis-aminopropyl spermidine synthase family protein n=1 Tax=Hahella ganghwensis TaxID=286420 RepID=UPI0003774418|nr:bis-aminopropyl spermidine synthase family protein [Hahella ganghwensis]